MVGSTIRLDVDDVETPVMQIEISLDDRVLDLLEARPQHAPIMKRATRKADRRTGREDAVHIVQDGILATAQVQAADQHAAVDDAFVLLTASHRPRARRSNDAVIDQLVIPAGDDLHSRPFKPEDETVFANPDLDRKSTRLNSSHV